MRTDQVAETTIDMIMKRHVQTLAPTASLAEAATKMRDEGVGMLVVVDGEWPVAVVTDRDLVVRGLAARKDPFNTPVSAIVSGPVISCEPDTPLSHVEQLMERHLIRRVVVVDEAGRLMGVVSVDDVAESGRVGDPSHIIRHVLTPDTKA